MKGQFLVSNADAAEDGTRSARGGTRPRAMSLGSAPDETLIPLCRPSVPPLERVVARLAPSYEKGSLTNGRLVRELEEEAARRLEVRHVVAVSSCTTGLMLAIQALDVQGPAVLPSFTFSATAHALAWNGIPPVFSDCDPFTCQIDVADAARHVPGAGLLIGVHVFGAPCPAEQLEALAAAQGVPLLIDAAHGFGALRQGRPVGGFGDAEVFSMSPTKPLVAGEGGLVATNDDSLARRLRLGRDYGNPGNYDTEFAGLNGRMSEFHAAVALESLVDFDKNLALRRSAARRYATGLAAIPGIQPQHVDAGDRSTYKDFTILIDEALFGMGRDATATSLALAGIETRPYFYPPVHRQRAYAQAPRTLLPVTDRVSRQVLSIPLFPGMTPHQIDRVCETLALLHERSTEESYVRHVSPA